MFRLNPDVTIRIELAELSKRAAAEVKGNNASAFLKMTVKCIIRQLEKLHWLSVVIKIKH